MTGLLSRLKKCRRDQSFLLLDGSNGWYLESKPGISFDRNSKLWNGQLIFEQRQKLKDTHLEYLRIGCDIITTSTFQASLPTLLSSPQVNSAKDASEYFQALVRVAVEARAEYVEGKGSDESPKPLVAVSFGPFGASLADGSEFTGKYGQHTQDKVRSYHYWRLHQLSLLQSSQECPVFDLIAIETFPTIEEVEMVITMIDKEFPGLAPVWVSFTTATQDVQELVERLRIVMDMEWPNVVAVGLNCVSLSICKRVFEELQDAHLPSSEAKLPEFICYPNNGVWNDEIKCFDHALVPQVYAKEIQSLQGIVAVLGGCCGTRPEVIAHMSQLRDGST